MKYYLKWVNLIWDDDASPVIGGNLLDSFVQRNEFGTATDIVYFKTLTSTIPQWIDCISHATPFDSIEDAEKMLKRIEEIPHGGSYGIEESIDDDLNHLNRL